MIRRTLKLLALGLISGALIISCKKSEDNSPYLVIIGGLIGTEGGIAGTGFNPVLSENRVFFQNVEATVTSASATLVNFIVPDLPWGVYEVTLISGESIYSPGYFSILFPVDPIALSGYFPLNGNAFDLGPFNYSGTEVGMLEYQMDRHGEPGLAAGFDGIDDVITTPATPDYQFRTISFWFYPTNAATTDPQVILTLDDDMLLYGRVRAEVQQGYLKLWAGGMQSTYSIPVQNNTWYHIALARDAEQTGYFINGSLVELGISDGNGETVNPNNNLVIGAGRTEDSEFFEGIIDEVIIFNRILTEDEVKVLGLY